MGKYKVLIVIVITVILSILIYFILNNINNDNTTIENVGEEIIKNSKYVKISASQMVEEIKNMNKDNYVILDVRTKAEYDEERIPNATLLTLDEIGIKASTILPIKDIKIYVYCRSGVRSKQATNELLSLGYKNVYDFGGIIDYEYEKIKGI